MSNATLEKLKRLYPDIYTKWVQHKEVINSTLYRETVETEGNENSARSIGGSDDDTVTYIYVEGKVYSELLEAGIAHTLNKPRATSVSSSGAITQRSLCDEYLIALTGYARMFSVEQANNHFGGKRVVTCNGFFDLLRSIRQDYFKFQTGDEMRRLCGTVSSGSIDSQEHSAMESYKNVMTNMMLAVSMANICTTKTELLEDLKLPEELLNIDTDNALALIKGR